MTNPLPYSQALRELETILADIEADGTDIDVLTEKVKRAAELLKICKNKLRNAEEAIDGVFKDLEIS